jgi:membrane protease subunit (stomatin/prohibitin family)
MTIRRPADDPNPLVATYHGSLAQGTPVEVEPEHAAVLVAEGATLAVFGPGTHSLPPSPGSARLYFVSTRPMEGVQFGGMTSPIAAANGTVTAKRVFGSLACRVTAADTVLLQLLSHGSTNPDPMLHWVRANALRLFGDELAKLLKKGQDPVFEPELIGPLASTVQSRAQELERYGVQVVGFRDVAVR